MFSVTNFSLLLNLTVELTKAASNIHATVWILDCLEIFSSILIGSSTVKLSLLQSLRTWAKYKQDFFDSMASTPMANGIFVFSWQHLTFVLLSTCLSIFWSSELHVILSIKICSQISRASLSSISNFSHTSANQFQRLLNHMIRYNHNDSTSLWISVLLIFSFTGNLKEERFYLDQGFRAFSPLTDSLHGRSAW